MTRDRRGFLYLRGGYEWLLPRLEGTLHLKVPHQTCLREIDFSPGFDLDAELETARQLTGRFGDHLSQV